MVPLKVKRENLAMTIKRKTNGWAHFAAKRETKVARTNQPKQQIKDGNKEDDDEDDSKVKFFLKVGKHKKLKFF